MVPAQPHIAGELEEAEGVSAGRFPCVTLVWGAGGAGSGSGPPQVPDRCLSSS